MTTYTLSIIVEGKDRASGPLGGISSALGNIGQIAAGILTAGAFTGIANQVMGGVTAFAAYGKESILAASRVNELALVNNILAENSGISATAIQAQVKAVQSMGIEAATAQTVLTKMVQANLDWSKAADVARLAQDAAVIAGINSSEATDRLIHGMTTMDVLILRNMGLIVDSSQAFDAYAKEIGKTAGELTGAEKQQAFMNATMKAGEGIAGAYAAAMNDPGKVLRSFPRYLNDIAIAFGQPFQDAFATSIFAAADWTKALGKAMQEGGAFYPVLERIGINVDGLAGKFADWLTGVDPAVVFEQIADKAMYLLDILDRIKAFGFQSVLKGYVAENLFGIDAGAISNVLAAFAPITQAIGDIFGDLDQVDGNWIDGLTEGFRNLFTFVQENGPAISEIMIGLFAKLIEFGGDVAFNVIPFLIEQFVKISDWFVANGPLITEVLQKAAAEFGVFLDVVASTWLVIGPLLSGLVDLILNLGVVIMQVAVGDWAGAWASMQITAASLGQAILAVVVGFLNMVTGWFGSSWAEVAAMTVNNWNMFFQIVSTVSTMMLSAILTALDNIKTAWLAAWTSVLATLTTVAGQITSGISAMVSGVASAISGGAKAMYDAGVNMLQGLADGISKKANEILDNVKALAADIAAAFAGVLKIQSPSRIFMGFGENIMAGLANGIKASGLAVNAIEGQAQAVMSPFAGAGAAGGGAGQTNNIVYLSVRADGDPDRVADAIMRKLKAQGFTA